MFFGTGLEGGQKLLAQESLDFPFPLSSTFQLSITIIVAIIMVQIV